MSGDTPAASEPRDLSVHARQLGRFALVGGSAVFVDFVVYFALVELARLPPAPSKAISFIAGASLSFVLNRGFVFRASSTVSRQVVPFTLLYLASLGLNAGVNSLILGLGAAKAVAWLAATGTSTVSNFLGMKFVVFRARSLE